MTFRYKIKIEYQGTNFIGWQKQSDNSNSVQETIEKAIFDLTGQKAELVGSGRTDAGVHSLGQIAHFDLDKEKSAFRMRAGLNYFLQRKNIAILDCQAVNQDFHSRFLAKMRHYQYRIINRHPHLTLDYGFAWHIPTILDIDEMIKASKYLLGTHDFSSFRDSECQAKSPIKTIDEINIFKEGDLIKINISAKSFLHHQVRNIVGCLVLVGSKKITAKNVKKILIAKDRNQSGQNAPAYGLYFLGVRY